MAGKKNRRLSITRRGRADDGFDYLLAGSVIRTRAVIDRINALAIPPAWRDVQIAESSSATVLAIGVDAAGRVQSIYHPRHRARQDRKKFERLVRFGRALPTLRARIDQDLRRRRLSEDRVTACVVRIIDEQLLRVGSKASSKQHGSYGATTLLGRHIRVTSTTIEYDFVGKSGRRQRGVVRDRRVARIVARVIRGNRRRVFRFEGEDGETHRVRGRHVNAYIKRHAGDEFTAKGFRTWGGTVAAATALLATPFDDLVTSASRDREIRRVIEAAAERLGNTPAVARSSYIDPRVLAAAANPDLVRRVQRWTPPARSHLSDEEQRTLRLIDAARTAP